MKDIVSNHSSKKGYKMQGLKYISGISIVFLMGGCAALHDDLKPHVAKTKTTMELCATYSSYTKYTDNLPNIKNELIRRNEFSKKEWELINTNQIAIGMSSTALVCSWGYPDRINRASYGNQAVYGRSYVYTKNNIVTAWN